MFGFQELGSSDESGKDWSDLEREAAEEDREKEDGGFDDEYAKSKRQLGGKERYPSPKRSKHDKSR